MQRAPQPPPRRLDVYLEGLAAYQEGAATLQVGTALALKEDGARLTCVTQDGAVVGLVPADKRNMLIRGPWSGTVRTVKRQAAKQPQQQLQQQQQSDAAAVEGGEAPATGPGAEQAQPASEQQQERQELATGSDAAQQGAAGLPSNPQQVVQVLVRFVPEEQRWEQRPAAAPAAQMEDEDAAAARLSTEQFEALGEL